MSPSNVLLRDYIHLLDDNDEIIMQRVLGEYRSFNRAIRPYREVRVERHIIALKSDGLYTQPAKYCPQNKRDKGGLPSTALLHN